MGYIALCIMLFCYIFTWCVIPDVLNNRTHVKSTKASVLLYPEITPYYKWISSYNKKTELAPKKSTNQSEKQHKINQYEQLSSEKKWN